MDSKNFPRSVASHQVHSEMSSGENVKMDSGIENYLEHFQSR